MYDIIMLPCPFCGANVDDILSEHTEQCYFTLNDELQNGLASGWTRDSVNKVNKAWNMRDKSEINHLKQLLRNVRATLHFSPEDVLAIDAALREDEE